MSFFKHKRVKTIIITIIVLFIASYVLPQLGISFDFKEDAIKFLVIALITAQISDMVLKKQIPFIGG